MCLLVNRVNTYAIETPLFSFGNRAENDSVSVLLVYIKVSCWYKVTVVQTSFLEYQ